MVVYAIFIFSYFFQAKEIFNKMYPDSEFLPRAPDPEEILLEGDESAPGPVFEGDSGGAEDNGSSGGAEDNGDSGGAEDNVNKTELVDEEG